MKSEILLEKNKYYKLGPSNIIILFDHLFYQKLLCYYINNTLMGQIHIDEGLKFLNHISVGNPTKFYADHNAIRIDDLEISNLLRSEDKTIIKMGITILFDKYNINI